MEITSGNVVAMGGFFSGICVQLCAIQLEKASAWRWLESGHAPGPRAVRCPCSKSRKST